MAAERWLIAANLPAWQNLPGALPEAPLPAAPHTGRAAGARAAPEVAMGDEHSMHHTPDDSWKVGGLRHRHDGMPVDGRRRVCPVSHGCPRVLVRAEVSWGGRAERIPVARMLKAEPRRDHRP
jgi:hypothetical protein